MAGNELQVTMEPRAAEVAAEMLKALGHPLRLRIVSVLAAGPMHVTGLAETLEAPQPFVSQQLRRLKTAGLVAARTREGHAYYEIIEPHLFEMLRCLGRCLNSRRERGLL